MDIVGDGQHVGGRIFSEDEVDKWGVEQRNLGGQAVVLEDLRQLVGEDVGLSALLVGKGIDDDHRRRSVGRWHRDGLMANDEPSRGLDRAHS